MNKNTRTLESMIRKNPAEKILRASRAMGGAVETINIRKPVPKYTDSAMGQPAPHKKGGPVKKCRSAGGGMKPDVNTLFLSGPQEKEMAYKSKMMKRDMGGATPGPNAVTSGGGYKKGGQPKGKR